MPNLIEWSKKYESGIEFIDYEHSKLIELINELYNKQCLNEPKGTVADCFGRLHARVAAHFALEENLMREKKFGSFKSHKRSHEMMLEDLRDMMDEHQENIFADHPDLLAQRLTDWLSQHFRRPETVF